MKRCSRCKLEKPLEGFYVERRQRDGRGSACKRCVLDRTKEIKVAKGLYSEKRMRENELRAQGLKECCRCHEARPFSNFRPRSDTGGPQAYCYDCEPAYNREYKDSNRDANRIKQRMRLYGITQDQYEQLWRDQDQKCASCGDPLELNDDPREAERRIHVDHCHETKQVRGLLCPHCNVALGHLRDDPARISALLSYIEESHGRT